MKNRIYTKFQHPDGSEVILVWRQEKELIKYINKFPERTLIERSNKRFENKNAGSGVPSFCKNHSLNSFFSTRNPKTGKSSSRAI